MPPEEAPTPDAPQTTQDSPTPATEAPAPADEPLAPPQQEPPDPAEPEPTPTEPTPTTEPPTAQMGRNEPLPQEREPITPEPPSAAAPAPTGVLHSVREVLNKARVAIQDHKRKKRDKIMQALNTRNKITNNEVEKLLHVSDATATRYLSALVKEGKIKKVGKTGHWVEYQKI